MIVVHYCSRIAVSLATCRVDAADVDARAVVHTCCRVEVVGGRRRAAAVDAARAVGGGGGGGKVAGGRVGAAEQVASAVIDSG